MTLPFLVLINLKRFGSGPGGNPYIADCGDKGYGLKKALPKGRDRERFGLF